MCVGACMETCEHVCVCVCQVNIHPNLHTYSLCVCVSVHTCTQACRQVYECKGVVFQCVSVSLYIV